MSAPQIDVREAGAADSAAMAAVYNHYIENSVATFETTAVTGEEFAARVSAVCAAGLHWLVARRGDELAGYAYAAPWNQRYAYRLSVETTVYVSQAAAGQGIGSVLYDELFARLRADGYHVAIAGISLPNAASVALHEKFGMRKVAHFSEVGNKFDRWIDVGYWQVILEREEHTP